MLVLCAPFLRQAWLPGADADAYALVLALAQSAFYLLPAFALTQLARSALLWRRRWSDAPAWRRALVGAVAFLATTTTAVGVVADARIFEIFGFHLNGFVLNLLTTPGGIDSMGLGEEGVESFAGIVAALAAVQLFLLWGSQRVFRSAPAAGRRRARRFAIAALAAASLGERITYAVGESRSDGALLAQANAFPLYFSITARNLLLDLGVGTSRDGEAPEVDAGASTLAYPLAPLRVEPPARPRNVVWLVGESLRSDALDPEIMPATYGLSRDAWRFTRHYSGGNGTRMGMFSMFYGVHGPYWFHFLAERRSPVLLDVLQQQGYQLGLFTSARFSYPEFDRTIFAHVPSSELHDSAENYHATDWERGWKNDRERVSDNRKS